MLCEKCGKAIATTHIRSVVNGVAKEMNLCNGCAAQEGYNGLGYSTLSGFLTSMFGNTNKFLEKKRCGSCGLSFSDIAESGKVGCSNCYSVFYDELLPYIKRVHGSIKHNGKVLNESKISALKKDDEIEALKIELGKLVAEEKFEEAAIIRDKIKELDREDIQ